MEKQIFHTIKIVINCSEHGKIQMFRMVLSLIYLFSEACLSTRYKVMTLWCGTLNTHHFDEYFYKNIATENMCYKEQLQGSCMRGR